MRQTYDLPGSPHQLTVLRFGSAGTGGKAYLQAGLHADEFPGMLVLRILAGHLAEAEAHGGIHGEILLVPQANPIGLAQTETTFVSGRIDNATGENFNRNYPDLSDLGSLSLGPDAASNVATIRAAMSARLAAMQPDGALPHLRHRLLTLAHDADLVLDLHADNEAEPHMYVGPALWPAAEDIAAAIDARAVLLSELSGGHPFDEAAPVHGGCWLRTIPMCPFRPPASRQRWRWAAMTMSIPNAPPIKPRRCCGCCRLAASSMGRAGTRGCPAAPRI